MDTVVYGPYTRNDGRKHVILYDGVNRKTVSYSRYLMEQHLGRKLLDNETVDHIDGDFTNDRIENLQILSRENNALKSFNNPNPPKGTITLTCNWCNKSFERRPCDIRSNKVYCSKECNGKDNH